MKSIVSFFEIPSEDFRRAVFFYEKVLELKLSVSEWPNEKIACFPPENGKSPGAVCWAEGFIPSVNGVLLSLEVADIGRTLKLTEQYGGKILIPKTKIEADGRGWFANIIDCEGNRIGLYSDK